MRPLVLTLLLLSCLSLSAGEPDTRYIAFSDSSAETGTGAYELLSGNPATDSVFVVTVDCPEGNFKITVDIAPQDRPGPVTIKAESRRLMIEKLVPPPHEASSVSFAVNVHTPALDSGGTVELNPREIGVWHWNDRLELEFHAAPGTIEGFSIEPAGDITTVYLAGDSTVTDQPEEPWTGWGQMLPRFFGPEVAVANHAESGLALSTFFAHRRFEKILDSIQPGDYLFIQFGHNDMKESGEAIGPWQSYSDSLRRVIAKTREQGARPVLVTPMQRRRFDERYRQFATLGDYPLAMRRVAAELDVPLIDLNQMSATLYAALGPNGTKKAFVHYPAGTFPGQTEPLRDNTHFNAYGGYELARCVVEGIRLELPELAHKLRDNVEPFDPASPDPFAAVDIPPSPRATIEKPAGN